ncbi:helix-turn-helix domain-containing protein [Streptomyces solicathayae]|uniref:Helix-turn-helix domain-containing protein n=1 Tax=Streptomyces solicathayae TaxID=3081768 RepID=A0ABZ0M035_9ACTN|nr:helix-turn-helix domain-containing protein [Streptomyces sp. HUAS YS2]WOX24975.1 helix-turn-helix domain-containing protein [Streptomyces sp. HUAS YS2]
MGLLVASDDVGADEERFDWFCKTVNDEVMPVMLSTRHPDAFRASITDLDLGVVRLTAVACSPVDSRRTATHVRRGDPEHVQLALLTQGALVISQRGNESAVTGGLVLTDTSRPSEGACTGGRIESVLLRIPRQDLTLSADRVDKLLAQNLAADAGSGAVLADFLKSLVTHGPHCRPEELCAMGTVALDLATAFLARRLGDPGLAPVEARARETLHRIHRFVENNLGDPGLTPQLIADRHNMSLRRLHALFGDQPLTVSAHIRHSRLEHARIDLASADPRSRSVQTIAARWGFSSATGFSRAFRAAYGITPSEHRANSRATHGT